MATPAWLALAGLTSPGAPLLLQAPTTPGGTSGRAAVPP
jgi:hypothetical protein